MIKVSSFFSVKKEASPLSHLMHKSLIGTVFVTQASGGERCPCHLWENLLVGSVQLPICFEPWALSWECHHVALPLLS